MSREKKKKDPFVLQVNKAFVVFLYNKKAIKEEERKRRERFSCLFVKSKFHCSPSLRRDPNLSGKVSSADLKGKTILEFSLALKKKTLLAIR